MAQSEPAHPRVDPTYAWCLALLPIALLAIGAVLYVAAGESPVTEAVLWVVGIGLCFLLAFGDSTRLRAVGVVAEPGWALLAGIAYLVVRTKRAKSTPAIPVMGGVALAVVIGLSVASAATAPETYAFKGRDVAAYIKRDLHRQYGPGRLSVTCPDFRGQVGQTAVCTADDGNQQVRLMVVIAAGGQFTYYAL